MHNRNKNMLKNFENVVHSSQDGNGLASHSFKSEIYFYIIYLKAITQGLLVLCSSIISKNLKNL